ncbi:hypothetical protein MYX07_07105, partial [Patescibacteria group bacterium AH-259-L07]|nr:hypothetical protein [Patescibacteria group bacterium AH-259-L07]
NDAKSVTESFRADMDNVRAGFKSISGMDSQTSSRSATGCANDAQCSVGMTCFEGVCVETPPQGGGDPLKGLNISKAKKVKHEISSGQNTGDTGDISQRESLRAQLKSERLQLQQEIEERRKVLRDTIKDLKGDKLQAATPEERESLIDKLRVSRQTFRQDVQAFRQNLHKDAKVLRENFRENMRTAAGDYGHMEQVEFSARIAHAHGNGLRMLNRLGSAIGRFDNIIGRLESRSRKLEARGVDISSVIPFIEEAKNMQVENEAKMEVLKVKYESLLKGENLQGIGKEAREIAQELKSEIKNLHDKLREIVTALRQAKNFTGSPIKPPIK